MLMGIARGEPAGLARRARDGGREPPVVGAHGVGHRSDLVDEAASRLVDVDLLDPDHVSIELGYR
ncbi:unannotated protein [freshwater metagenome]|uniref:Unannotated protein n=1 Tax=freshwater metagenome TaxID=449393 RepID=A0A6J7C1U7_9ZZZZ